MLPAPAVLGGYRILREIGSGGMATVYLAEDVKHNRHVAIKLMKQALVAAIGQDRFLREIEIAARLNHPHVVPLFDSGAAGEHLFYVMPYIEGESLRARLAREGQLPLDEALRLAREVSSALSHAHQHGLVHRDVKPENILLADGIALVTDFGIAHTSGTAPLDRTQLLTTPGGILGTPTYMSPEQACGEPVGPASDIYSLACVVFEMLAGHPPFEATSSESAHPHAPHRGAAADRYAASVGAGSRRAGARARAGQTSSGQVRVRGAVRGSAHCLRGRRRNADPPLPASRRCPRTTFPASGRISSAANASSPNAHGCSTTRVC